MSRDKYIREIDKNTKYFHTVSTIRNRRKLVSELRIENRAIKNPRRIKQEARRFYRNLYSQEEAPKITVQEGLLNKISWEQAQEMEKMPTLDEIKEAMWSCGSTKAPGPDGFNMFFIKNTWNIIGVEFSESMLNFFRTSYLPRNLNMTW
ncbi:hypothetical protein AAHE18_03G145400 [Arachis hypogaea]